MVTYTQIHKAIVKRIQTKFKDIVFSTDITEGIERPSFFISIDNIKSSDFMREALDRNLTVRIYYFSKSKDNNRAELLNIQDDLTELFLENNLIKIDEYVNVEIDELELDTIDKVLHCYFDIKLSENYNRIDNDTPYMEELEIIEISNNNDL